jgi:crotonobetainyl-CoA:carnitine CoA-transferase CaiB-like acyl-CoA transferase
MDDPWAIERGLSLTLDLDGAGRVRRAGVTPRLSRTPARVVRPARPAGADSREVLAEIGLGDRADDLIQRRIVAEKLAGVVRDAAPVAGGGGGA